MIKIYNKEQSTPINKNQSFAISKINGTFKNKIIGNSATQKNIIITSSAPALAKEQKNTIAQIELKNKLLLFLNKKMLSAGGQLQKSYTQKINDKMISSLNQSIVYNFAKNNNNNNNNDNNSQSTLVTLIKAKPFNTNNKKTALIYSDLNHELNVASVEKINPNLSKVIGKEKGKVKKISTSKQNLKINLNKTNQVAIINKTNKIISSFFASKSLGCLISRPQLIYKNNKIQIRIFYYQKQNHNPMGKLLQQTNSLSNKKVNNNSNLITPKVNQLLTKTLLNLNPKSNEQPKNAIFVKASELKKAALLNFASESKQLLIKNNKHAQSATSVVNFVLANAVKAACASDKKANIAFPVLLNSIKNNNKLAPKLKLIKLINKKINLESIAINNHNNNYNNNNSLINFNKIKLNLNLKNKIKNILIAFVSSYSLNNIPSKNNLIQNNLMKIKLLAKLISKIFKKNIDLQLIRLHNIGLESKILATMISKNTKTKKSLQILKILAKKIVLNKANILNRNREKSILVAPSKVYSTSSSVSGSVVKTASSSLKVPLTGSQINDFNKNIQTQHTNPLALAKAVGLKIKFSGRLAKDRIVPKKTSKTISVGSLSRAKVDSVSQFRVTSKNKKGAFSITVKLAHARAFSTSSLIIRK